MYAFSSEHRAFESNSSLRKADLLPILCRGYPGLLTKKFIDLIKQAEDGVLDLNKAADTLHVSVEFNPLLLQDGLRNSIVVVNRGLHDC